jgi:hypothetical protein
MLATICYAVNPRVQHPIDGFVSFSPDAESVVQRRRQILSDIRNGNYNAWGEDRKVFIKKCLHNGWDIKVKVCAIANDE